MPCYFRLRCDANTDAFLMGRLQPLVYFRHADVARQAAVGNSERIAAGSTSTSALLSHAASARYVMSLRLAEAVNLVRGAWRSTVRSRQLSHRLRRTAYKASAKVASRL